MRSSTNWHSDWLVGPDDRHACRDGCHTYHLLAPVLHSLGYFLSYERYPEQLRAACARATRQGGTLDALVVGTESEESLAALLTATRGIPIRFDVVDRCATPLNRVRSAMESVDPPIRTIQADVARAETLGAYDLVVADSFLKQFSPARQGNVVAWLRHNVATRGVLVLREYVGAHQDLLASFATQLDVCLTRAGWHERAPPVAQQTLANELPKLSSFMLNSGATISNEETLLAMLKNVDLHLLDVLRPPGKPYVVVTCTRSR